MSQGSTETDTDTVTDTNTNTNTKTQSQTQLVPSFCQKHLTFFYLQEKLLKLVSIMAGPVAKDLTDKETETRQILEDLCKTIMKNDPEFILKVRDTFLIIRQPWCR